MNFEELLASINEHRLGTIPFSGIAIDSRLVKKGDLFIAAIGHQSDGRLYIQKAIDNGAVAILYQSSPDFVIHVPPSIIAVAVPDLASKIAAIASHFYQCPSNNMALTGVTGTNGKTTIAYQLAQAAIWLGDTSAYIGTLGYGKPDALHTLNNTTPGALELQAILAKFNQSNTKRVSLEVSSHALSQGRVDGLVFNEAIFTNLTHDHLDYHHTMEAYAAAKAKLFKTEGLKTAIVNSDDPWHSIMLSHTTASNIIRFGIDNTADVKLKSYEMNLARTDLMVDSPWGVVNMHINMPGKFNISNALAIFSTLMVQGFSLESVLDVMPKLKSAPGRMELVHQKPTVLVDYAHTPDALLNALKTLNELKKGRLWVVFGCGGDRDTSKRPEMGQVAASIADVVVITSDNPRTEDPKRILDDITNGFSADISYHRIVDRKEAILFALQEASDDDIILIAGKGHEDYQIIGQKKYDFSDQNVVRQFYQ